MKSNAAQIEFIEGSEMRLILSLIIIDKEMWEVDINDGNALERYKAQQLKL